MSSLKRGFNKTYEAISISDSSPFIDLTTNTERLIALAESAQKTEPLKKIIAQVGLLMRSGKLKNILFIISKLVVSKQNAEIHFNTPTSIVINEMPLVPKADPTKVQVDEEKKNLKSLFNVIQKNSKIVDATLRTFAQFNGKEVEFSDWIITHPQDLNKIEELVIQSDIELVVIKNPAIKFMHQLGQAEQPPELKSVDQTYLEISEESAGYEKFIFTPVIKWIAPDNIKNRLLKSNQLLPAIGNNLHTIGLEFFRRLFFELDRVSTKNYNGLRAVTAFAHARLISAIVQGTDGFVTESTRVEHILKFVTRNSKTNDLSELLKVAVSPNGQNAFFKTYDLFTSDFVKTRSVGSNSAKLLALAGFYSIPDFDEWLLRTFRTMLIDQNNGATHAFFDLLAHPVVSEALPD